MQDPSSQDAATESAQIDAVWLQSYRGHLYDATAAAKKFLESGDVSEFDDALKWLDWDDCKRVLARMLVGELEVAQKDLQGFLCEKRADMDAEQWSREGKYGY